MWHSDLHAQWENFYLFIYHPLRKVGYSEWKQFTACDGQTSKFKGIIQVSEIQHQHYSCWRSLISCFHIGARNPVAAWCFYTFLLYRQRTRWICDERCREKKALVVDIFVQRKTHLICEHVRKFIINYVLNKCDLQVILRQDI